MCPEIDQSLPVIFLMGPTASGKTGVAMDLAASLPVDIISVDSAMVYRGLDIGTAKPAPAQLALAPHRLIDICEPTESYSAGAFCRDASAEIDTIHARGRIPLLVGGTGLYFRALEQGFSTLPESDPGVREAIEAEAARIGWDRMHERLAGVDPQSASRIHTTDPQRIGRALEIWQLTGAPASALYAEGRSRLLEAPVIKIILAPEDRARLHRDIETRFHDMIKQGFIDEVAALRARGDLHANLPSMRLVGYRQIWAGLDGQYDHNTMIEKGIFATRQLARRQLTWLRRETAAHWVNCHQPGLSHYLLNFLRDSPFGTVPDCI